MNKTTLLMIIIMATSASAAITFTLSPATGETGETVNLVLNLQNDEPIWGFSAKIIESSPITFSTATSGARLEGGISGATQNTPDRITAYSAFGGNTPGITAGTGPVMTLTYTIPEGTPAGEYQLDITELTVSNSEGSSMEATGTGAKIKVIAPLTKLKLPKVRGSVKSPINVNICLSNTHLQRTVKSTNMVIAHDPRIVKAESVTIHDGSGSHTIASDTTTIAINGLNIQNADCDAQTGINIATIRYTPIKTGTTPLIFQSASATDQLSQPFYATQQFHEENGEITFDYCERSEDCEDGNPCTTGTCIQGICQYHTIPNCGGGGGSGGSQQYTFSGCKTCAYAQYSCCGTNLEMINRMCERPEAYAGYCTKEQATPTFNTQTNLEETEEVEEEIEETEPAPPQEPVVITPEPPKQETIPTTGQAVKTATPKEPIDLVNMTIWMLAFLVFGASIYTAYVISKGKPILPRPPSRIPTPVQPIQPPVQPAQPSVQQLPSTESNKVINFIERKTKEQQPSAK